MKKMKFILSAVVAMLLFSNCNKEEKLMERLEGNWKIVSSVKTIHYADGYVETIEELSNAGTLVMSEGSSDDIKNYDFFYVGSDNDTIKSVGMLVTDESNSRMVMEGAYTDTTGAKNIVWTIEKEKKNKQIWSTYGVDSTLFYPANNNNPGAANNWVVWTITLKREK